MSNTTKAIRRLVAASLLLAAAIPAVSQSGPVGAFTARGEATVEAAPDYFDFSLRKSWRGETLAEAAREALAFEKVLLQSLESRELRAQNVDVQGISIPDLNDPLIHRGARIRFSAGGYRGTSEALLKFAGLCDTLRELARELACEITGPEAGVNDAQVFEQAAIGQALSQTLPLAEGGVTSMSAQVMTVNHAEVEALVWNAEGAGDVLFPQVAAMTCTASVIVTYDFGSNY
jgi:hypothetical protein